MRDFSVYKFETPQILKPLWQNRGDPSINLFFYSIISFKSQTYFHTLGNFKIEMCVYSRG